LCIISFSQLLYFFFNNDYNYDDNYDEVNYDAEIDAVAARINIVFTNTDAGRFDYFPAKMVRENEKDVNKFLDKFSAIHIPIMKGYYPRVFKALEKMGESSRKECTVAKMQVAKYIDDGYDQALFFVMYACCRNHKLFAKWMCDKNYSHDTILRLAKEIAAVTNVETGMAKVEDVLKEKAALALKKLEIQTVAAYAVVGLKVLVAEVMRSIKIKN
jgi:hypothetical protein